LLISLLPCRLVLAAPADDLLASLQPTADVNDFAGVLSPDEREALEQRCRQLRERSGAQLAVVVLRSLRGGQVDDFTVKLFERWKVGQAGQDNGVMLLVSLDDRKARVEVGYRLEAVLPDALAGRVLQEQLFPAFRQRQYAAGLMAAVNRIAEIVERNEPAAGGRGRPPIPAAVLLMLLTGLLVFLPSLLIGICLQKKRYVAARILLLPPAAALLIAKMAGMSWVAVAVIMACGAAGVLLGCFVKQMPQWDTRGWRPRGVWPSAGGGGTWPTGTGSWGSWGGGGFSGSGSGGSWGGFGGGRSGGGGASGSW
jgi:uncharacterized protein